VLDPWIMGPKTEDNIASETHQTDMSTGEGNFDEHVSTNYCRLEGAGGAVYDLTELRQHGDWSHSIEEGRGIVVFAVCGNASPPPLCRQEGVVAPAYAVYDRKCIPLGTRLRPRWGFLDPSKPGKV